MSAFAFTLHIEKSTEICIIKEQMTRTGHGWMKNQHRHTHTHTNKVTNIHAHAHSRSQTKCRNAKPEVKLVNWLPCTFSYSTCNSVACMAYAVHCAVMEERGQGCRRRIHLTQAMFFGKTLQMRRFPIGLALPVTSPCPPPQTIPELSAN